MDDKEIEAIEEAKRQIEEVHNLNELCVFMTDSTTLKTLLNLIDKLQKENEELQYKLKEHIAFEGHKQFEELKRNTISKDKIRNKIKEAKEELEKEMKEVKDFTDFNPMIPVLMTEIDTLKELLKEE